MEFKPYFKVHKVFVIETFQILLAKTMNSVDTIAGTILLPLEAHQVSSISFTRQTLQRLIPKCPFT